MKVLCFYSLRKHVVDVKTFLILGFSLKANLWGHWKDVLPELISWLLGALYGTDFSGNFYCFRTLLYPFLVSLQFAVTTSPTVFSKQRKLCEEFRHISTTPYVGKDKLNRQNDRGGCCRGWSNLWSVSYRHRSVIVPPGILQGTFFTPLPMNCASSYTTYLIDSVY